MFPLAETARATESVQPAGGGRSVRPLGTVQRKAMPGGLGPGPSVRHPMTVEASAEMAAALVARPGETPRPVKVTWARAGSVNAALRAAAARQGLWGSVVATSLNLHGIGPLAT